MLHLDLKYTNLLSSHFERFTRKNDYLFNVRCPLCGDSQKQKTKMRGYIHRSKRHPNQLEYSCHNCSTCIKLGTLLKQIAPQLYKEYQLESVKESRSARIRSRPTPSIEGPIAPVRFGKLEPEIYQSAERIDKLPHNHHCRMYVEGRLIPKEFWSKLYYTEHYRDFLDELLPGHDKPVLNDARLVIPYYDAYGAIIAVTGRALQTSDRLLRYITIRTTPSTIKLIYGLDRVDQNKTVYIVEGPLDSLFLSNAVASGDSHLIHVAKQLSAAKVILVYDNEPRNKENVYQLEQAIKEGYDVVIWPEHVKEKDINSMVLAGLRPSEVQKIIDTNVWSGLRARTHLAFWKKITTQQRSLV